MPKLDRIQVRCTAEEKERLINLATQMNMRLSSYIRNLIFIYTGELEKIVLDKVLVEYNINKRINKAIKQLEALKTATLTD